MDARTRSPEGEGNNVDARLTLAAWLRAGRDRRKLTIEDVAKITKIQARILEKLESGQFEGLPAEVFVKGFVRSFAKCVGLDETEALDKYSAAQAQPCRSSAVASALVETMARPIALDALLEARRIAQGTPAEATPVVAAPVEAAAPAPIAAQVEEAPLVIDTPIEIATPVVEPAVAVEATISSKKKRGRKNAKQRNRKRKHAQEQKLAAQDTVETAVFDKIEPELEVETIEPIEKIETGPVASIFASGDGESLDAMSIEAKTGDSIVVDASADGSVDASIDPPGDAVQPVEALAEGSGRISQRDIPVIEEAIADSTAESIEPIKPIKSDEPLPTGTWQPTMPPIATTSSVPWRRPSLPTASASRASTYVVPSLVIDDADPDSADRERDDRAAKEPQRLSFLPPILLDREDRSARQGGLTLAVIILLIAATLTLSYLMRRPSPSGDGVTMSDTPATLQA